VSSGGEKTKIQGAKVLGLVAAVLVMVALLLTVPLASFASARGEARAGGAVAIAGGGGGGDCDVETNDVDAEEADLEEDILEAEDEDEDAQTQDGNQNNGDQTQDGDQIRDEDEDNVVRRLQNGNGNGSREARTGGAVAIAGGGDDCDAEADEDSNVEEDVEVIEDDEEIEDRTGQPDDTIDTSDLDTLPPDSDMLPPELQEEIQGSSSGSSTDEDTATRESSNELSTDGNAAQENRRVFSRELEANEPGDEPRRGDSERRRGRLGTLPLSGTGWTLPRKGELDKIDEPRRFEAKPGAAMNLSIRALGLYDVPVANVPATNPNTRKAFDRGVVHVRDTAYPWDRAKQKNVFLAGHRLGPRGEDSRLVFYHLDELKPGHEIVLKDRRGRAYTYRVREIFKVRPDDAWVADTQVGRDLLTLQTYTLPNFEERLVVQADRVQPHSGREKKRR